MQDTIKVHVAKYPDRDNLVMRHLDPLTGKQVSRSAKTTKMSEAVKAAGKWESELHAGTYRARCRMTWQEFRDKFDAVKLPTYRKEGTAENITTALNHLENTLAPQRIADITTPRMTDF